MIRCPRCGRAADGVECLACGYLWSAAPAPAPAPVTGLADSLAPPSPPVAARQPLPPQRHEAPPPPRAATPAPAPLSMPPPVTFGGPATAPPPRPPAAPPSPPRAFVPPPPVTPPPMATHTPTPTPTPTPTTNPLLRQPQPATAAVADPSEGAVTAPGARPGRSLASWIVATVPPASALDRFLRSPLAFVASGGLSFVVVLGFGSLLLLGGADPELHRIDSGQAGTVIEEILGVPVATRTPRQFLLLGHAYARNGATPQALDAYREAAKRGGADERALDYALAALDHPFAKHPIEVLVAWQGEDVTRRLVKLTEAEGWHLRHNALKVLQERGQAPGALAEKVAIVDVRHGPDCDRRREGLGRLEALGKGDAALDAIQSLRDNYKENFCIPLTELDRAQISVEKRR